MGQISLQMPSVGQPNSTEDPKIASNFSTLQTLVNGNIDPTNLNPAGGVMSLALRTVSGNTTAAAGDLIQISSGNPTITLPASPPSNSLVGVFVANGAVSGASPVTVSAGGAQIFGVGCFAASSILLGTPDASVIFRFNGSNWLMTSGQQDTGWVALTPVAPFTGSPLARLIGSRVEYSGTLSAASSQTPATEMATIPSGVRLPGNVVKQFALAGGVTLNVNGSGTGTPNTLFTATTYGAGATVDLSAIAYRTD